MPILILGSEENLDIDISANNLMYINTLFLTNAVTLVTKVCNGGMIFHSLRLNLVFYKMTSVH